MNGLERVLRLCHTGSVFVDDRHPQDRLHRELGLFDTTMLCVSSIIGAGIFLTPGPIAALLPHPGLFLAVWLVGGLLSLAGALANAELGAMFPRAGGDYVYLREAYHPFAGFIVGWLSFFVIYAGTVATLAAGFAEGVSRFVGLDRGGTLLLASATITVVSAINYAGVRRGARLNNITALIKVLAIVGLSAWAFSTGRGSWAHFVGPQLEANALWTNFGLALSPVLFSYLGWNAPVYVASEIHRPGTTIPRALFLGLGLCIGAYLLLNVVYLYALPIHELSHQPNVGEAAARVLLSDVGATAIALLVLASVLGCLNATVLVGPRIAYAMALDGYFFPGAERVHDRYRTPHGAIVAQGVTAIALVLVLQGFPRILDYTTFAIVLATIADTAALYTLRRKQPERPRPYRAWGYPWLPALYLVANGAIAASLLWGRPVECAVALTMTATALPFYRYFQRHTANGVSVAS
ncbi:MAG: APC family permease [Candidatus Binatia bacterium]|nr:APC family permease [Candidatus Binatia bacterium]